MVRIDQGALDLAVALLAEGVDRNNSCVNLIAKAIASPSSRRAWIEMTTLMWVASC